MLYLVVNSIVNTHSSERHKRCGFTCTQHSHARVYQINIDLLSEQNGKNCVYILQFYIHVSWAEYCVQFQPDKLLFRRKLSLETKLLHREYMLLHRRCRQRGVEKKDALDSALDAATISSGKVFSKCFCLSEPVNFIPQGIIKAFPQAQRLLLTLKFVQVCNCLAFTFLIQLLTTLSKCLKNIPSW